MIEDDTGNIEYDEQGSGVPLVLVPGSCSTGAAWRAVIAALGKGYRCITTSLPGYGRTAERRPTGNPDVSIVAEALEKVVHRVGEPVHLVGHSFGGLVSVALALRRRVPLASLTVLEAPAVELLRLAGDQPHYAAFKDMSQRYFAAHGSGDPAAIEAMVDFYGGAGTFASWPERVRAYVIATTPVNILDWASAFGFAPSAEQLAGIGLPSLVAAGADSHPAIRRANAILASHIAGGALADIAGASHFMISTHPREVAALVERHIVRACER